MKWQCVIIHAIHHTEILALLDMSYKHILCQNIVSTKKFAFYYIFIKMEHG